MSTPVSTSMTPSAEVVAAELARVLSSSALRGSEPLRNLLRFLAKHSLDSGGTAAREHDIAVEVFARRDFDARIDSVVWVQTGRLRSKLAEYYMGEGSQSEIVLEIPKGSYGLSAHCRVPVAEHPPLAPSLAPLPRRKSIWARTAVIALLVGVAVFYLLPGKPSGLQTFWQPFVRHADDVIVSFSNPRFVGQSITGLKLYEPGQQEPPWINETYSGTGEVFAIYELTRTLSLWHKPISLRRARQMVWEEAKHRDLIFLGAPSQNSPAGELRLRHFRFENNAGTTGIANLHPRPGEPAVYLGSGPPFTQDYALIAEIPGFDPSRRALILAGTTTYGTQAAAEFVSREGSVAELLGKLGVGRGGDIPPFEAILQVRVTGGVAVESNLSTVRVGK